MEMLSRVDERNFQVTAARSADYLDIVVRLVQACGDLKGFAPHSDIQCLPFGGMGIILSQLPKLITHDC